MLGDSDRPGFHEIDNATAPTTFEIHTGEYFSGNYYLNNLTTMVESEPGMELGAPQQVNLPLPSSELLVITWTMLISARSPRRSLWPQNSFLRKASWDQ